MKKKYWKTVILLTLVATLLTGMLLGCSSSRYGELGISYPGPAELHAAPMTPTMHWIFSWPQK